MWEYEIQHKVSKARTIIFGYSFTDACRRSNIIENDYDILFYEYVD